MNVSAAVIILIIFTGCVRSLKITVQPQDVTAQSGNHSGVTIACVFDSSAPLCYWEKDGSVVEIDGRYEFTGNPDDGDCSLLIIEVTQMDEGKWRCGYPMTSQSFLSLKSNVATLTVGVMPPKPVITFKGVPLSDDDDLYLPNTNALNDVLCWLEDTAPPPIFEWRINGTELRGVTVVTDTSKSTKLKIIKQKFIFPPNTHNLCRVWFGKLLYCVTKLGSYQDSTFVRLIFSNC